MINDYEALEAFLEEYDIHDATIRYDYRFDRPSTLECSIPLISAMRMAKDLGFLLNTDDNIDIPPSKTGDVIDISYLRMMGFEE